MSNGSTHVITAERIETTPDALVVFVGGRRYEFAWAASSRRLARATHEQRAHAELSPGGYGIHWPLIDEDLSVAGLLRSRTAE